MEQQGVNYKIVKEFGVLSYNGRGDSKQVNFISYNGFKPKFDIRKWTKNEDGSPRMSKGITLSVEEAAELKAILNGIDLDELGEADDNNKGFTGGHFGGGHFGGGIPFDVNETETR